ncbi:MAG: hypothetical protein RMJ34_02295 [candidate division WOR-3 bacterium]|nr:hypothetical protein [candidate division WOR-3 bacterium]
MIWCSSNFTNHEVDLKGLADVRTNGGLAISYFLLTYQGDIGYPIFCLKSQVFSSVKKEKID